MRIFERFRSVFALPTRMTGKSSTSKEETREAKVEGYHLPGKTPQTAPPSQDLNVVNDATKVDPRAMAEPGSRYPEGDGPPQGHIFHMLPPPVFDHATSGVQHTSC
jgi:hypothetical protein